MNEQISLADKKSQSSKIKTIEMFKIQNHCPQMRTSLFVQNQTFHAILIDEKQLITPKRFSIKVDQLIFKIQIQSKCSIIQFYRTCKRVEFTKPFDLLPVNFASANFLFSFWISKIHLSFGYNLSGTYLTFKPNS